MSRPRHLWSGDWESDSAAVTRELDRRRGEIQAPAETRADGPAPRPRPPARPSAFAQVVRRLRRLLHAALERYKAQRRRVRESARERRAPARSARQRGLRMALLAVLVGLLSAAVAYGVVTLLVGSGGHTASAASRARPWLGVDLESIPANNGLMIALVVPGSPAATAGLTPGDMITAINGQPVNTTGEVKAAIDRLHVGSQADIQYNLGLAIPGSYTAQLTVAAEPPGYP
jgi:membrane-associated protease RseP (regulator of RpoE activity)